MTKTRINLIKHNHEQKRKTHKKHLFRSAICGIIALAIVTASILAIAKEQKRDYYITQASLTAASSNGLIFAMSDGNLWAYSGNYREDIDGNAAYTILFDGNGTDAKTDGVIIRFWKSEATEEEVYDTISCVSSKIHFGRALKLLTWLITNRLSRLT